LKFSTGGADAFAAALAISILVIQIRVVFFILLL